MANMTDEGWIVAKRDTAWLTARHPIALLALAGAFLAGAASAAEEDGSRLAAERGCNFCHSARPAKDPDHTVPPPGPAWSEIAKRYRGKPGAEDKLVVIVGGGSDPTKRHWYGTSGVVMPPNRVEITEQEARTVVRWILRQ